MSRLIANAFQFYSLDLDYKIKRDVVFNASFFIHVISLIANNIKLADILLFNTHSLAFG